MDTTWGAAVDAELDTAHMATSYQLTYVRFMSLSLQCLERILYVWMIRHPASGYVQGVNGRATPFFEVFLSAYVGMWFCQ